MSIKSKSHTFANGRTRAPRWVRDMLTDPLTGQSFGPPAHPWHAFADDDDDDDKGAGGGAGGGGSDKTFKQEDVDRIVKQRLKKQEREFAKATKENEKLSKQLEELTGKFEDLTDRYEKSNKSDAERELTKLQREMAQLNSKFEAAVKEKDEAVATATQAVAGLTKTRLEGTLREALRANKAHGRGMDQAVRLMMADGAGFDDDGNFLMKVDDVPYDKPAEAAQKWLSNNLHFVEGTGGGAGTPRGSNGKLLTTKAMDDMPAVNLMAEGLKNSPS